MKRGKKKNIKKQGISKKRAKIEMLKWILIALITLVIGLIMLVLSIIIGSEIGENMGNVDLGFAIGLIIGFAILFGVIIPVGLIILNKYVKGYHIKFLVFP